MKSVFLKDICEVFGDGDWIESKDQSDSGIRLIQTGNVGVGVFKDRIEKARWISEETFKKLRCTQILEGDVLVSRLPDPVGRACLIPALELKAITAVDCSILRFDKNKINSKYFIYYSQSSEYSKAIEPLISGATRQRISREKLGTIQIPLPSLDEQRKIVEILDKAFAEIDLLNNRQKESTKFVSTMLQSYVDDLLLRDQDESVPLTNLAILENGDRGSNYPNKNMREDTGVPFINAGHIGEGKLDMSQMDYISKDTFDKLSRGKIQRNDLLFCLRGSLGKTAILSDLDEGAIASSLVIVRAKDGVNPKFLLYYFLSSICKSEIEEYRSGTAQPNLGGSDLKKFSVPLHSQTRMEEIVTKVDEVASQIETLTQNSNLRNIALAELKQSILNSVFTFEEAVA